MSLNQTASNATLIYAKSPQRKIMILRLLFSHRLTLNVRTTCNLNVLYPCLYNLRKKVFNDTLNYDIEPLVVYH